MKDAVAAGEHCLGRCLYISGVPGTGKVSAPIFFPILDMHVLGVLNLETQNSNVAINLVLSVPIVVLPDCNSVGGDERLES